MTPDELRSLRAELRATQESLARILGVDRRAVIRWEAGQVAIPRTVELALDNIRRHRAEMTGNHYPLMADVLRVMQEEGLTQDDAVRAFGVEP